jgi:outer membrane protein W
MKRLTVLSIAIVALCTATAFAQSDEGYTLLGSSSLEFYGGLWGSSKATTTTGPGGVEVSALSSGFNGRMAYSYGLRDYLALTLSAGFLGGEASASTGSGGTTEEASAVMPVLMGMKYYVPEPLPGEVVRPFIAVSVGPYFGFEANSTLFQQEARAETVIGARLAAGVDFVLGRHFKLGVDVGYNAMSNFSEPIGARKNYNGADFSMGFGFMF